jgi:hypothetical protein
MNGMEKIMAELNGMVKTAEDSIKNSNYVMMVQKQKKNRKH